MTEEPWGDDRFELSDDVLAELGRLSLAAVWLEDIVYAVCRAIKPRHGPGDDGPIGRRIDEALMDLATCPVGGTRLEAEHWLNQAKDALVLRNAVLHSVPVISVPFPGTTPTPQVPTNWLTHFPRDTSRRIVNIPLTIEGLRPIRVTLQRAQEGWREIALYEWDCYPRRERS